MTQPKESKTRAPDGCQLFYRIYPQSEKPRLVLIHSLALDTSIWEAVVTKLAPDFELLTCDCRGHGRSEHRAGPYTIELFAHDLAAVLEDARWPAASVAGCSMGGCVAQAFAAAYPDRAQALGLIDTTAWYGPTARADWSERAARAAESGFPGMIAFQLSRWFSEKFRAEHADTVDATCRVFLANEMVCYQASCEMLGELDLRAALASYRVPVSIIVGEQDHATPLAMSHALHSAISGSTLHVLSGGRHITPVECPTEIAAYLRDLVRRAARVPGS
jgi:3-oxoadipate enol-lactonase